MEINIRWTNARADADVSIEEGQTTIRLGLLDEREREQLAAEMNDAILELVPRLATKDEIFGEMLAALKVVQGEIHHIASEGNSCEGEDCIACTIDAAIAHAEAVLDKKGGNSCTN